MNTFCLLSVGFTKRSSRHWLQADLDAQLWFFCWYPFLCVVVYIPKWEFCVNGLSPQIESHAQRKNVNIKQMKAQQTAPAFCGALTADSAGRFVWMCSRVQKWSDCDVMRFSDSLLSQPYNRNF